MKHAERNLMSVTNLTDLMYKYMYKYKFIEKPLWMQIIGNEMEMEMQ